MPERNVNDKIIQLRRGPEICHSTPKRAGRLTGRRDGGEAMSLDDRTCAQQNRLADRPASQ